MKSILVTGSIAYDHLLSFDGEFKDSFIAEKLDNLSLSFFASEHQVFFGGCGPNIAFSLKLLGETPIIFGVAGNDFQRYEDWLGQNDISVENIYIYDGAPTASASILTDKSQNQLTIFSPAAMMQHPAEIKLKADPAEVVLAIISPELPERMAYFGRYFSELGIPYIFDPGQALPVLDAEMLEKLAGGSVGMILNEYEAELFAKKVGHNVEELRGEMKFVIVTCGAEGCKLYTADGEKPIAAVKDVKVVDSTGCGDAFRSGFMHGYVKGQDLAECCRIGNETAAIVLQVRGTQNHAPLPGDVFQLSH